MTLLQLLMGSVLPFGLRFPGSYSDVAIEVKRLRESCEDDRLETHKSITIQLDGRMISLLEADPRLRPLLSM